MNPAAAAPAADLAAPLRSEAFFEDLHDLNAQVEPPWRLREAGLAALLCAVPLAAATLGSLVNLIGGV